MTDFAKLLNDKMKKAADATKPAPSTSPPAEEPPVPSPELPKTPPPPSEASFHPPQVHTLSSPGAGRKKSPVSERGTGGSNTNRVTVNLFDADRRALAVIKEHLANAGHDFTNRSDSIKIALRLAAKARREDLAALLLEVRAEDRRFSAGGESI